MPCVPIGMTVTCGRTSRLNRFLSIPRYDGASRSRIRRGLPTHVLTAEQDSEESGAVWAGLGLLSTTMTSTGAGVSAPLRIACAAASQRKAELASRQSGPAWPVRRVAAHGADIVREPLDNVAPQPADPPAAKTLTSREATEQCQRCEYPAMTARQPGYVMGRQQLLEGGKSLIDPLRERDALGAPAIEGLRS